MEIVRVQNLIFIKYLESSLNVNYSFITTFILSKFNSVK